jgi:hypothetical protein
MKRFQLFAALFFALTFSAWLARADQHTDDTGILVGLIGIGGFLISMVEPRRPWMWGLIVPAGIIVVEVWNYVYGNHDPHTGGVGGLCGIAALTIGIACAGSYVGAFIRGRVSAV